MVLRGGRRPPGDHSRALHPGDQAAQGQRRSRRSRGLRSLFRALKQERLVFRDPTKGIVVSAVEMLPTKISSDRLRGMLDRASRPVTRVVIVLAEVHGLRPTDIMRARLADLDLSAGRLIIHRVTGRHVVYLDELSHTDRGLATAPA
jgi:integrase